MGFRSGFERTLDAQLKMMKAKYSYETLKLPYVIHSNYNPDFILDNGVIIEAKGVLKTEDRRKMIAVKQQHPELDIRFVFMSAGARVPGQKGTHAQWAERYKFPWADGRIPEDWLI